jgi:hypothetical protein
VSNRRDPTKDGFDKLFISGNLPLCKKSNIFYSQSSLRVLHTICSPRVALDPSSLLTSRPHPTSQLPETTSPTRLLQPNAGLCLYPHEFTLFFNLQSTYIMGDSAPVPKPEAGEGTEHLNIKVTDGNNEVFFKIKRTTPLKKLMDAFCDRQGKAANSVRFLFDGTRVNGNDSPDTVRVTEPTIPLFTRCGIFTALAYKLRIVSRVARGLRFSAFASVL